MKVDELVYEVSDLLYHLLVLLVFKQVKLEAVYNELVARSNIPQS